MMLQQHATSNQAVLSWTTTQW